MLAADDDDGSADWSGLGGADVFQDWGEVLTFHDRAKPDGGLDLDNFLQPLEEQNLH